MLEILINRLVNRGFDLSGADTLARVIIFVLIIVLSLVAYWISKRFILKGLTAIIGRTETQWDDIILRKKVFNRLAYLVPAMVIYISIPIPFEGYDWLINLINGVVLICMIGIGILALDAFLNASLSIYRTYDVSNRIPIKGFIQVAKIFIYFTSGVFIISILLNKTPIYLFSSLGALTAVLMFIFKDSILGFVAGIQLSANRMVANGDWIEMSKYGADGNIVEIALTTVKVQNWDKTITTIPTYALITESFKNWRGMSESGGRRIKRSINLDINTIQFCTEEMIARFSKIQYISDYIEKKKREVQEDNKLGHVDNSSLVNGRRMTNIGTFRAYVEAYLINNQAINQDMTFLVRQLEPTEHGLPLEIYVFSKDQEWANYENIQANIFDHILAVVPEFDLRVFQDPSGRDFKNLAKR
ncbi:mechanosensitive ion channel family protein [Arcticibacterium luteifluviistationis]|uniref:Mechanosensing system component YbdG n=1 Tax=Arcticibacterium luteifluviistationis TaxID=1784714 RepID=A0A2Z4GC45_9BACT|nr:mechanosensitive ion channel domain-containing protein [Arcticibacterium luteifluviistationis]AWV98503.1 mechanosensitive ion channel protein MscS [Arcticibacterium luteifluviistationis]